MRNRPMRNFITFYIHIRLYVANLNILRNSFQPGFLRPTCQFHKKVYLNGSYVSIKLGLKYITWYNSCRKTFVYREFMESLSRELIKRKQYKMLQKQSEKKTFCVNKKLFFMSNVFKLFLPLISTASTFIMNLFFTVLRNKLMMIKIKIFKRIMLRLFMEEEHAPVLKRFLLRTLNNFSLVFFFYNASRCTFFILPTQGHGENTPLGHYELLNVVSAWIFDLKRGMRRCL